MKGIYYSTALNEKAKLLSLCIAFFSLEKIKTFAMLKQKTVPCILGIKLCWTTSECTFTCRGFLIYVFFPLFKILRCGMINIRHVSHMLIKHMKIFLVYNYEKLVITELVESTGLTVLVARRPNEQFSLTIPMCMLQAHLKRRDYLMNTSRFPWGILSHEILANSIAHALCVNNSVEYIQPWGTTFDTGA